jgi:hypothetical protein
MRAPDLVDPVVGFRAWRVIDDRLLSPYIPCRWDGAVMRAVCFPANRTLMFGRGWLDAEHESPHPDCKCGIYAYHRPGTQSYFGEWDWLEGIVTVWGRIEAYGSGLRAEHARVQALAPRDDRDPRVARAVAVRLGVDAVGRIRCRRRSARPADSQRPTRVT